MKDFPLVSVITTVYNTEKYVERCFDSVMEQTYPNIEFIVVNNGSSGNIEEIVEVYIAAYPKRKIKLLTLEENQGVFNARISGAELATGDYIAFIDSDDRISIDFYRRLISHAEKTGSDMVATDFVFEGENELYYHNFNGFRSVNFKYLNEEVRQMFFKQHGLAFYWNLIWNKIYSIDLWKKACPYLKKNNKKIVMCDDMGLSCVLYCFSSHYENIHDVYYYYLRVGAGSSEGGKSAAKFKSILQDVKNVFEYMHDFLSKNFPELLPQYHVWKDDYAKVWCREIANGEIRTAEKKMLFNEIKEIFKIEKITPTTAEDDFFYSKVTLHNDKLEEIRRIIADENISYVSFDIFDTLLMRPFWEPNDMFIVLANKLSDCLPDSYVQTFPQLRLEADRLARKHAKERCSHNKDVTLSEIYDEFAALTGVSSDTAQQIMKREQKLEMDISFQRDTGKQLYDLAVAMEKKVICVTDMYLPRETIQAMLQKNKYDSIFKIYISSEYRTPKCDGLFKIVLRDLRLKSPSEIIHIGDNYYVDCVIPNQLGIQTAHMTKTVEMLQNKNRTFYAGESFDRIYLRNGYSVSNQTPVWFLRNRCMLALVAKKMFDNPWVSFNPLSDFNADPYFIGYYVLGFFVDAIVKWLIEQVRGKYAKIQFVARDGYVMKSVYDIYAKYGDEGFPSSGYFYISRNALMPIMVDTPDKLLDIMTFDMISNLTPEGILTSLQPLISEQAYERRKEICKEHGIAFNDKFESITEWIGFVEVFGEHFFSEALSEQYHSQMRRTLEEDFPAQSCTFDIGYSGRTELVLSELLRRPIDAFYVYLRKGRAAVSEIQGNFKIHAFFENLPSTVGSMLIETILSDFGSSCKHLVFNTDGSIKRVFDTTTVNFQTEYVLTIIQNAALDFITDICTLEKSIGAMEEFSSVESTKPFEYYVCRSKEFDRSLFSATAFKNGLFNESAGLLGMWNLDMGFAQGGTTPCATIALSQIAPKWKRYIVFALTDRRALKDDIKQSYATHPYFLKLLKVLYCLPRKIYHIFKRG